MTKTTRVGLPTFIELHVDKGRVSAVRGVRSVLSQGTEEGLVLELGSVPLPNGLQPPQDSITTFYGFTAALKELQYYRELADRARNVFVAVDLSAELSGVVIGVLSKTQVADVPLILLERLTTEARKPFVSSARRALEADGKDLGAPDDLRAIGMYPELIGKVLKRAPFKNAKIVVYKVPEGDSLSQVASCFSYEALVADVRQSAPIDRFMAHRLIQYVSEAGGAIVLPEEIHDQKVTEAMLRRLEGDPANRNFKMKFRIEYSKGQKTIVHSWDGLWKGRKCTPIKTLPPFRVTVVIPPLM